MDKMKDCSNIFVNAFLKIRGIEISEVVIERKNRVVCLYNLSDEEWRKLKLEYSQSEVAKVEAAVRSIKELGL